MSIKSRYAPVVAMFIAFTLFTSASELAAQGTWHLQYNHPAQRFIVLEAFNSEAVLDQETFLVWEQAPTTTPRNWQFAQDGHGPHDRS